MTHRTTLVLDPRLAPEIIDYIKERTAQLAVSCELVPLPLEEGTTKRLLREFARHIGDGLVVVASEADLPYFEGAELRASPVQERMRGYTLRDFPDILPLPDLSPPELWRDGPCLPAPELKERFLMAGIPSGENEFEWDNYWSRLLVATPKLERLRPSVLKPMAKLIRECEERGQETGFSLFNIPCSFFNPPLRIVREPGTQCEEGEVHWLEQPEISEAVARYVEDPNEAPTIAWQWRDRIFALGADSDRFKSALAPHHEVIPASLFSGLSERVSRLNPWNLEGLRWQELQKECQEKYGVDLTRSIETVQRAESSRGKRSATGSARLASSEESQVRSMLRGIASRAFEMESDDKFPDESRLQLLLSRAVNAPLVALPGHEVVDTRLLADMGSGHILNLRVRSYPDEEPRPLTLAKHDARTMIVDGGDVRVYLEMGYDELLEGAPIPRAALP